MRMFGQTPYRVCLLLALTTVLAACGGGGGGGGTMASAPVGSAPTPQPTPSSPPPQAGSPTTETAITSTLSGSVGDGPIVGAGLTFYDKLGGDIASFSSGSNADYVLSLTLKPQQFPLQIEAIGGTDLVSGLEPDFRLFTAVLEPGRHLTANINPFSTLIILTARSMRGGITPNNITSARTSILTHFGFGLDRRFIPDPLQTPVDETNIAIMVKTSEALGETIRRTRDALMSTDLVHGNDVMEAIAADLVDGMLDGRGAAGASRRIAAVATLASAKVLAESLVNELAVNGVVAAGAMDNAIAAVRPAGAPGSRTGSVMFTQQAIDQAARAIGAAAEVTGDPVLAAAVEAVVNVPEDTLPGQASGLLSYEIHESLELAVQLGVYASDQELTTINGFVRSGVIPARSIDAEEPPAPVNPANYRLSDASFQVSEGNRVRFQIERDTDSGEEYVIWRTRDDSAKGYDDYQYVPSRAVRFAPGELSKTISIETYDDGDSEPAEHFKILLLEALGNGRIKNPSRLVVTLKDNGSVVPPPAPTPDPQPAPVEYAAPLLDSVNRSGDLYTLAWSHSRDDLDGGFDIVVDGDVNPANRTNGLSWRVGPLNNAISHCFQVEARYARDGRFPRSNTICVDAAPAPAPNPDPDPQPNPDPQPGPDPKPDPEPAPDPTQFVAPVVRSIIANGEYYTVAWDHPMDRPRIEFDVIIDGVDTNTQYRGSGLGATVGPLDPGAAHCFRIEVWYLNDGQVRKSDELCTDAQADINRAPSIEGQPNGVATVGSPWSFAPVASDPNNDTLSFSIANKPGWASFDPSTGLLSGAPAAAGLHSGIVITVSDGQLQTSLPAFAIDARPAAQGGGSVSLEWTPPTVRADGSALPDLSGYRIYKGTTASNMSLHTELRNPGLAAFVVSDLAAGQWTFRITAMDGIGQESELSNAVSATIN